MDDGGGGGATTLATGLGFVEGPTLTQSGELVFVSLDQQRLYALDPGGTRTLASFAAAPNGATEGLQRAIYVAAFSGAWPAREECTGPGGVWSVLPDGRVETVTSAPQAPNDLCFGPDGLLYVTDPVRGERRGRLWRVDVASGTSEVLADLDWYPNGIGFDRDDALWVADTVGRRMVRVSTDGGDAGDAVGGFALRRGKPDGFAFDVDDHIVVAAPPTEEDPASTVQMWSTDGELVDVVLSDASTYCTNVAIGGDGTTYVTDAREGAVLRLDAPCAAGLPLHPFRSTRG